MEAASSRRESVLVVEDDPSAAQSLFYLLNHYGYGVRLAGSVQSAIDQLNHPPDIILLDLHLPDGYGTSVMEALLKRNLSARVAVVTATIDTALLRRAKLLGPELMFSKPLDFLELLEQLRAKVA